MPLRNRAGAEAPAMMTWRNAKMRLIRVKKAAWTSSSRSSVERLAHGKGRFAGPAHRHQDPYSQNS